MPTDCYFQLESSREYTRVVTGESIVDAGDDCKEVGIEKIQSTMFILSNVVGYISGCFRSLVMMI